MKYSDMKGVEQAIIDRHPTGLWFSEEILPLRSSEVGGMPGHSYVIWVWCSDLLAQSSTNAFITYAEESVAHPIYAREYIIRRDAWELSQTIAMGLALTALIGVTITAGGTGYTQATGTIATGATVVFVCSGGAIIAGIVTKEGASVTSGGAITITGDGTAATATAVIQPATAVLVRQEKRELPADSNLSKEFVRVVRVYETLPGPALTGKTMSEAAQGAVATTTSQLLATGAADYTPTFRTLSYSDTPVDANRKERNLVVLGVEVASAEVNTVTTTGILATSLANQYFTLSDASGPVYGWFNANTAGVDPAPLGYRGIAIAITAAFAEVSTVSTVGAVGSVLNSDYFTLADTSGAVYGWFNYNATGVDPAPGGRGIAIAIATDATETAIALAIQTAFEADAQFTAIYFDTLVTITDIATGARTNIATGTSGLTVATLTDGTAGTSSTSGQIATAIAAAFEADASFTAVAVGNVATITNVSTGNRTDINPGTSGLIVATTVQGGSADLFPTLIEYDQDEESGAMITTYYTVVEAAGVVPPSVIVGVITRYKRIDKWRSLQIITVFSTPPSYSEYKFAAHNFPSLFEAWSYNEACGATFRQRSGFSAFTHCRVDISYGSVVTNISGLLIKPNTFSVSKFFRISEVLNNQETLTLTGDCSGSLILPASVPSRSQYQSLIGGFSLIAGESGLWKARLFRTTRLYYKML